MPFTGESNPVKASTSTIIAWIALIVVLLSIVLAPFAFIPAGATLVAKNAPCDDEASPSCDASSVKNRKTGLGLLITGCILFVPMAFIVLILIKDQIDD